MSWEYRSEAGRVWFDDKHGIILTRYDPGAIVTLENARSHIEAIRRHADGRRYPLMVDISQVRETRQPARRYLGSEEAVVWRALALVGGSPIANMMANIYLALSRSKAPQKFFRDEASAISWLRQFCEK
jgi:hypothetical protein